MSEKSAKIIQQFICDNRFSKAAFARVTGLARFTIYKYLAGGNVHPSSARKMEKNLMKNCDLVFPHEKLID